MALPPARVNEEPDLRGAARFRLLASLLPICAAIAAPLGAGGESSGKYSYYRLGAEQGLAGDRVYSILQDRRGLLWFGLFGGIARYDGHAFATFRPAGIPVSDAAFPAAFPAQAMIEDARGRIWISTGGDSVLRYDPFQDAFDVLGLVPASLPSSGAGRSSEDGRVVALALDGQGRPLVARDNGTIYRWNPGAGSFDLLARVESPAGPLRCLLVDSADRVWMGFDGGGLALRGSEGEALASYRHRPFDPASLASDRVSVLYEDALGGIWIGYSEGGVDFFVGGKFRHARAREGAPSARAVRAICEDGEGRLWIGWERAGLGIVDPSDLAVAPLEAEDASTVLAIRRDRRNLMWIGLEDGGIRAYNLGSALFSRYEERSDGQPIREPGSLSELPDGRVVFGSSGGGLSVADPARGRADRFRSLPPAIGDARVAALRATRDGTLWIGTEGGGLVALSRDGRTTVYRHDDADPASLADDWIGCLAEGGDGTIRIGVAGVGLDLLDPATGRFEHLPRRGPRHRDARSGAAEGTTIRCLLADSRGRIWAGASDGLLLAEPGSGSLEPYRAGPSFPELAVNCLLEDSGGGIWIGTGGAGLFRLDPERTRFERIGTEAGLLSDTIVGLAEDRSGALWVSTPIGLSRYDRRDGGCFSYGAEDGLASSSLAPSSILVASDGRLWVGGARGLTSFDPVKVPRYSPQPDVVFAGIELAGGGRPRSRSLDGSEITIGHDNGGLFFRIAVIDYVAPARDRYAVRLEGRQAGWSWLGPLNSGYLAPLAPGRYILRAKASNGNGVWNEYGATLSVVVEPPLWGTWWFRTAAALAIAAAAAAAVAARVGALRKRNALLARFAGHIEEAREEERKMAARDVHDEIGQSLMALNFHAYWLSTHGEAPVEDRSSRVKEMQRVILEAMAEVKSVASRLRPVALDILDLADSLSWYARSFERTSGIAAGFEADLAGAEVRPEAATALFRILQEMLSNVLRHSGARKVGLRLWSDGRELVLEARDDGRGISEAEATAHDSFGIVGMRERCAALGGSFVVEGAPGGGTRAEARIPLVSSPPAPVRTARGLRELRNLFRRREQC